MQDRQTASPMRAPGDGDGSCRFRAMGLRAVVAVFVVSSIGSAGLRADEAEPVLAQLRKDAGKLEGLAESKIARQFLRNTASLPAILPRRIYRDEQTRAWYSEAERQYLGTAERKGLREVSVDERLYYFTKYGSPLAYVRAIDLLGRAGLDDLKGKRLLDFGYGSIGHLRLLAHSGAEVVGVDVDPFLRALYSKPRDQGVIWSGQGPAGTLRLVQGRFPAEPAVNAAVGTHFDVFISKNTLKNGYLHPERECDPRMLIDLGVDDDSFVRTLSNVLSPGAIGIIYNLSPAPAPPDKPYIPWADGRCPFSQSMLERAGLIVLELDRDDSKAARRMGHLLGWDKGEGAMDLEADLFAHYTLFLKGGRATAHRIRGSGAIKGGS